MKTITKDQFKSIIQALKNQHDHDEKCSKAFQIILPNDHISIYDNSFIINQTIKLLEELTNDEYKLIDYFIYELEFGAKYVDGNYQDENGKNIKLSSVDNLWERLTHES